MVYKKASLGSQVVGVQASVGRSKRVEARIMVVAGLMAQNYGTARIAKELSVSLDTALRDINAVLKRYQTEFMDKLDKARAIECLKIDEAEAFCVEMLEITWRVDKDGEQVKCAPNWRWLEQRIKLMERRAKLLGLDLPAKIDIGVDNGRDEYARESSEILDRLFKIVESVLSEENEDLGIKIIDGTSTVAPAIPMGLLGEAGSEASCGGLGDVAVESGAGIWKDEDGSGDGSRVD